METKQRDNRRFITILSDGKFHETVLEGTDGAIKREYEDKNDVKQIKWELVFDEVSGRITKISFKDGDYGKFLNLEIDNDGVISMGTTDSFGEDMMKKLPSINFSTSVKLIPYSFEVDGRNKKGITVYQDDIKIDNFYWDKEKSKPTNGIPEPEGDTKDFTKDDWKIHFIKVRKFLISEVEKLTFLPF